MDEKTKEIFMYSLAALVVLCTIGWFGMLMFVEIPPKNEKIIDIAAGVFLGSGWTQVLNYFFGSSKGSKDKTKLLAEVEKKPV